MNDELKGKRILFFSPAFFGYEQKIKDKMQQLGATVDFYDERSVSKSLERALLKVNPNIFNRRTESYYLKILEQSKQNHYDYVLFIKCDMPTQHVLEIYRKSFPDSCFCLHMWDSVKNIPHVEEKFRYFDLISSFDRMDCKQYDVLHFRPLYYCDDYCVQPGADAQFDYDLCFIGTLHSDRYRILCAIQEYANKMGLRMYTYPYLQSKFIFYFYRAFKKEFHKTNPSDFRFDKISSREISDVVRRSKCVIDIQHPKQTGLTIRTIEMIGMNKKLITTNADIRNYDFYDPENITVIDREQVVLDPDTQKSYRPLPDNIYRKYSLEAWIYEVLGL